MYLCNVKITLVITIKRMKELNELEKTELAIERIKAALRSWKRQVEIMEIDPEIANKRINDLLEKLSAVIKKRDYLKK